MNVCILEYMILYVVELNFPLFFLVEKVKNKMFCKILILRKVFDKTEEGSTNLWQ